MAVVGLLVQVPTADSMLPLAMAVSWATAMGERGRSISSAATAQTDEAAATCIAHRPGPRIAGPCHFPYVPGPKGGEVARHSVSPHLGRLTNAEMAGGEAQGGHLISGRIGVQSLKVGVPPQHVFNALQFAADA